MGYTSPYVGEPELVIFIYGIPLAKFIQEHNEIIPQSAIFWPSPHRNIRMRFPKRTTLIPVLVSSVIILFMLEATARFYYFKLDMFDYVKIRSVHHLGKSGLVKVSSNHDIYYELIPNLDTYHFLKKFTTNADGLRDKDYSLKKPANTFRVAVMGSSFSMPTGAAIEKAWHSILEKKLNSRPRKQKYEFINFAVAGYKPLQSITLLKEKALS